MNLTNCRLFYVLILYQNIHYVIATETRSEILMVKDETCLQNPYWTTKLAAYNVIFCGYMCMVDTNCTASCMTKLTFDCEFYDDSSPNEIFDSDKTLIAKQTKWPKGTYSLMKPNAGCPGTDVDWKEGSRYHDTENDNVGSGYVILTNMTVDQDELENIRVHFCTKDVDDGGRKDWPSGNYCILQFNTCPAGFESGFIRWDDEDTLNVNEKDGTLPAGSYNQDTTMSYCCREDGSVSTPIVLPATDPFYLLRFTGLCQGVHGMSVVEETIFWDCEDNGIDLGGLIQPFEDGLSNDVKLHFCYYYI